MRPFGIEPPVFLARRIEVGADGGEVGRLAFAHRVNVDALGPGRETYGRNPDAQAVGFLDCEVRDRVEVGNHTLFVGEIVDAGFLKDETTPVLRMEDTKMNYGG